MPKFPTKILRWVVVIAVCTVVIVSVILNVLLGTAKAKLTADANALLSEHLDAGHIFYIFPDMVVITDITVSQEGSTPRGSKFFIPVVWAKFSVWPFITKKGVIIKAAGFRRPSVRYDYFCDFLRANGDRITAFLMALPRTDFKFAVKEARFDFAQGPVNPQYLILNLALRIKGDTLLVTGNARKDKYGPFAAEERPRRVATGAPFEYDFKGILLEDGFLIDNFVLKRKSVYLKLWGDLQKKQLQLNGFSFIDTYAREEYQPVNLRVLERIKSSLKKTKEGVPGIKLDDKDVYIIDIDCLADLSLDRVRVRHLNFNLNDMPVSLAGDVSFHDLAGVDLLLYFYPARSRTLKFKNIEEAGLRLKGFLKDQVFISTSELHIDFDKSVKGNLPLERVEGVLDGLELSLDEHARSVMELKDGRVTFWMDGSPHKVALQQLKVSLKMLKNRLKVFEARAPLYGGSLTGKIWSKPWMMTNEVDAALTLENVDAGQMDDLLVNFAKAEGRLSGNIYFSNLPGLKFNGDLNISGGRLKEFKFFEWLADTFRLPSLRVVDFHKVSSKFYADMNDLKFHDILLESKDVNIKGYFNIDRHGLVSSYLSLAFSKELLFESPKCRPIVKIFGGDVPAVIFDFQLSGKQEAMNFQWLPSDHKRRIQERIPDFIERGIERDIDEMIEPSEEGKK